MAQTIAPDRTFAQPWGTTPDGEFTRQGITVAFVVGTFGVFLTGPLGILGVVLSSMGQERIRRSDPSARTFLMWSWICFAPGTFLGTLLVLWLLIKSLTSLAG